jgi:hypothetical protein
MCNHDYDRYFSYIIRRSSYFMGVNVFSAFTLQAGQFKYSIT